MAVGGFGDMVKDDKTRPLEAILNAVSHSRKLQVVWKAGTVRWCWRRGT